MPAGSLMGFRQEPYDLWALRTLDALHSVSTFIGEVYQDANNSMHQSRHRALLHSITFGPTNQTRRPFITSAKVHSCPVLVTLVPSGLTVDRQVDHFLRSHSFRLITFPASSRSKARYLQPQPSGAQAETWIPFPHTDENGQDGDQEADGEGQINFESLTEGFMQRFGFKAWIMGGRGQRQSRMVSDMCMIVKWMSC
nr:hypothetical protein CFP56_04292 [Quercus suber]